MAFNYSDYKNHLSEFEKRNAPSDLFIAGDENLLLEGIRISVVGARKATTDGLKRAKSITKKLVEQDIIVVSGLAEGIDSIAHRTAIEYGGKTIAVLGTPLNRVFPVSNKELYNEILKNHLAISQFPEGYPVTAKNFPIRNRTMALISDATIIIEASENSGTRHQGWEALRLGRKVFILESIINDNGIKWAEEMLNYGAEVLTRDNFEFLIEHLPATTSPHYEDVF